MIRLNLMKSRDITSLDKIGLETELHGIVSRQAIHIQMQNFIENNPKLT